ncbi:MAG TPA: hypothetical protein VIW92_02750 [Thermoanaerobaculia bacterium]
MKMKAAVTSVPMLVLFVSLLGLVPLQAAEMDLASDPLWRALVLEAPGKDEGVPCDVPAVSEPAFAALKPIEKSTCTASCGTSTISCTSSGTCTAVDRNCSAGQRGYVKCGTATTYCPSLCPISGTCNYDGICVSGCAFGDPDCPGSNPCVDNPSRGCYYVWSPQDGCCYTNNAGCLDICY